MLDAIESNVESSTSKTSLSVATKSMSMSTCGMATTPPLSTPVYWVEFVSKVTSESIMAPCNIVVWNDGLLSVEYDDRPRAYIPVCLRSILFTISLCFSKVGGDSCCGASSWNARLIFNFGVSLIILTCAASWASADPDARYKMSSSTNSYEWGLNFPIEYR